MNKIEMMRRFSKFTLYIFLVIFLASCAAHHPYAKARPKPGKKKSCNCPDFGYNPGKHAYGTYFYGREDTSLKIN
jgi:hypothetical protein